MGICYLGVSRIRGIEWEFESGTSQHVQYGETSKEYRESKCWDRAHNLRHTRRVYG